MKTTRTLTPSSVVELGEAFAGGVNTTIARRHGVVTRGQFQFTAFFESMTRIVFARRDLRDGSLQKGSIDGCHFRADDDHNAINLGIDPAGYLHVAYDHHAQPLQYRTSARPLDVTAWNEPVPMTGRNEMRVTYPQFLMRPADCDDREGLGELWFIYRDGCSGEGDVCLKCYDHETGRWADLAERFVKGTEQTPWTSNAYWDHPTFDRDGRLMLSWVWRLNAGGPPGWDGFYNQTYGFAASPDGKRWFSSHGVELSLPMTPVNNEVIHALTPGVTIFNMAGAAADSQGRMHIVNCAADVPRGPVEYRHLWFDGNRWRWDCLSDRGKGFELYEPGTPTSLPDILIDSHDRVYVIFRGDAVAGQMVAQRLDPPDYEPPGETLVLWPDDLGGSDPIVDRIRWARDGVLSMYVQPCAPYGSPPASHAATPARLVDWDLAGV